MLLDGKLLNGKNSSVGQNVLAAKDTRENGPASREEAEGRRFGLVVTSIEEDRKENC